MRTDEEPGETVVNALSTVPRNLLLLGCKFCEKMVFYERTVDGRLCN